MPAESSCHVAGRVSKHKRPHHYRSLSQSISGSSSALSDVEGDPNNPAVKLILEKKRKAKNQRRYYHRYVMLTILHYLTQMATGSLTYEFIDTRLLRDNDVAQRPQRTGVLQSEFSLLIT